MYKETKLLSVVAVLLCLNGSLMADVELVDSGKSIVMKNSNVSMTIGKETGRVTELLHGDTSLLAPQETIYFTMLGAHDDTSDTVYTTAKEKSSKAKFQRMEKCEYRVHTETAEMVDVSFTPERTPGYPFKMEIHYVLRKGDSGFYYYIVASQPASAGKSWMTQLRYGMRVNDSMTNIRLMDDLQGQLPDSKGIKNAKGKVMDATYALQSGEIITKYNWACETESVPVYGLHNGNQGIWMITGGNEFVNGGPTKQHNTCHATDKGPIMLKLMYSSHFGSSGSYIEGDWKKIYGPCFVYLNKEKDSDVLWADAKLKADEIRKAWPFSWMKHPLYPVKRANVSGSFKGIESAAPAKGWVVLAEPEEKRGLSWQQQGADTYIYRAPIHDDWAFEIPAVRKGKYTLYAFADDIVGEFRKDNVVVDSSGKTDLGNLKWTPRKNGKLLWRIGKPNRSAAEFKHGDEYRQWGLWFKYRTDFPDDVDFTIGKSNEKKDWNYAQMLTWESPDGWKPEILPIKESGRGHWRAPQWKIRFNCEERMKGKATLTLGIAGASPGALGIKLNGKELGKRLDLENDSSLPRSGIKGRFREKFISFDASLLKKGENIITLDLLSSKLKKNRRVNYSPFGVLYDYIQLEFE